MIDDEPTLHRSLLVPTPDETALRTSRPPEEERTLVDLYRPEPTFEVQVLTNPDGLPIVSVRPASRRENTWSRCVASRRPAGEHTRLAVKSFRRSLRWKAARAWVLAFGLGGSAMAGAVAVLFVAGLLPGYEIGNRLERPAPSRSVADGQSVLTMREPQIELSLGPATPTVDDVRGAPQGNRIERRTTGGSRRRGAARQARPTPMVANAFGRPREIATTPNPDSPTPTPRLPPSAPLGISDSAGF